MPKNLRNVVYSLLFPLYCPSCEKHLDNGRGWLCPECWSSLIGAEKGQWQHLKPLKKIAVKVAFQYDDVTRMLVQQMKFNGRIDIAEMIGEKLALCFGNLVVDYQLKAVIPVPLHPVRVRERGYDQNLVIANSFGRELNLPVYPKVIKRIKNTKPQSRLSNSERMTNLRGAFKPVMKTNDKLSGTVILLDDVIHTGSTAVGCVNALNEAGIKDMLVISAFG
ncbi:ComF family protein [bacterium]|nr:ComF family protein [bacterium]